MKKKVEKCTHIIYPILVYMVCGAITISVRFAKFMCEMALCIISSVTKSLHIQFLSHENVLSDFVSSPWYISCFISAILFLSKPTELGSLLYFLANKSRIPLILWIRSTEVGNFTFKGFILLTSFQKSQLRLFNTAAAIVWAFVTSICFLSNLIT